MITTETRQLRTREDLTSMLYVLKALEPYLLYAENRSEIDEEVKTSAEATMVRTCNRIDNLIDATGSKFNKKFDAALLRAVRAGANTAKAQAQAYKSVQTPSVLYRPALTRLPDGQGWAASYGDVNELGKCVIGIGDTPAEAMLDFDRAFTEQNGAEKK